MTHIDRTTNSISNAIAEAESTSGVAIKSVIVGIAGDHIQSFQSRGVISISGPDHEVTQADIDRLIEDCKRVALPSDRKIIHVIPQEFIIDGQDGVYDPLGMAGVRMEANVHIITGLVSAAQNIYKCVQRAGLEVTDMVLEPLASSYAVLDEEEKEVGIALIDVGGGTTDLATFEERTIRHTAVIGIAGKGTAGHIDQAMNSLGIQARLTDLVFSVRGGFCGTSIDGSRTILTLIICSSDHSITLAAVEDTRERRPHHFLRG